MKSLRTRLSPACVCAAIVLAAGVPAWASPAKQFGPVVRVDLNATGFVHDGETWETAFLTIQEGVDAAAELVAQKQTYEGPMVWVAEGTYAETVTLTDGVVVWGGFDGTEALILQWSPKGPETIIDGEGVRRCLAGADGVVGWMTLRGGMAGSGGAAYVENSVSIFISCRFVQNQAGNGGAIHNATDANCLLLNCVFDGNTASGLGGAIFNEGTAVSIVTNCTFARNMAEVGGGMYSGRDSASVVTNCLFWNNTPQAIHEEQTGDTTVSYCNVEGGFAGVENINLPPLFVDLAGGDFHLTAESPCIDAGSATSVPDFGAIISLDIEGNPRGHGEARKAGDGSGYDIGAYEYVDDQCEAVTFTDASLEDAIREILELEVGDICAEDLLGLTNLTATFREIVELDGIEYCENLTNLALSDNGIIDLEPLRALTQLSGVYLANNQIVDISWFTLNEGIGSGDVIDLTGNPLGATAINWDIPSLEARGVTVIFDEEAEDSDRDGLTDEQEEILGTDPDDPDTDDDGLWDGVEVLHGLDPKDENDAGQDVDGDGLTAAEEIDAGTNIKNPDTDADGMNDGFEVQYDFQPGNPADADDDADEDGYTNVEEARLRANPRDPLSPTPVYYVHNLSGSDVPQNGTLENPWQTISYALSQVSSTVESPVTLRVFDGFYIETVTLEPGISLIGDGKDETLISGYVVGAHQCVLRDLQVLEPDGGTPNGPLVEMDNVAMRLRGVTLRGNAASLSSGIIARGSAPAGAVITDCEFDRLDSGIEIYGALPAIRRCLFRNISGDAIVIHATAAKDDGDGSLGDTGNANSGWNAFRDVDGYVIVNDRPEPIKMENNSWPGPNGSDTDDHGVIATKISGDVDFDPPLAKGSSIIPATIICTVWDKVTLAPITNGSVQLGSFAPVTDNTDGVYTFACVPGGTYTVTASASNYDNKAKSVTVSDGDTASPSFPLTVDSGNNGNGGLCGGSKLLETKMAEWALPPGVLDAPGKTVSPTGAVALRLTAGAPIDPASVWADVSGAAGTQVAVTWRPTTPGDGRDGWAVVAPKAGFPSYTALRVVAGALTVDGERVGPASHSYRVGGPAVAAKQGGVRVVLEEAVPPLPAILGQAASPAYRVAPEGVFLESVALQIPVPQGVDPGAVQLYYFSESLRHRGWHAAENVKGWLVANSRRSVNVDGRTFLEVEVNHSGVVQLGLSPQMNLGAMGSVGWAATGSGWQWLGLAGTAAALAFLLGNLRRQET